MRIPGVNRELLPVKAHYFIWNAGFAHLKAFLSVYIKYLGFSGSATGVIFTFLPLAGIFGRPSVGWLADKFKCQKAIFLTSIFVAATGTVSLLYIPKFEDGNVDEYTDYRFPVLLVLMMVTYLSESLVVNISDTICFEILGNEKNKYGFQRCFGALGWGIFSIFAGLILDSGGDEKNYTATFYTGAAIVLIDFVVMSTLKYEQKPGSKHIISDTAQLLKKLKTITFSIWCILMGMCVGLIWNFLMWMVEDLSEDSERVKTLEGIMMSVQCLGGELPFFFLSGFILNKLGHVNTMSFVLLGVSARFILYSVISNPWYFIPVELLNGITFALFYACMASYASIVAIPGTETTVQGTVGALFEIGTSLGSFAGGSLYEKYGGQMTFRIFGIAALMASVLHFSLHYFYQRFKTKTKNSSKKSDVI